MRTQIYLTKKERSALAAMAKATGKKQSELIREAVDNLIGRSDAQRRIAALEKTAGMWKDRDDLPDFLAIRKEWDRR